MKYMGSKNRIAKEILPLMLESRSLNQVWVEPFVGGANMIDKVEGARIGADVNRHLIEALVAIQNYSSELPQTNSQFTEEDYQAMKKTANHWLYGYVAFALSYGGKFWGGWRRDKTGKRDYVAEAYRSAIKQAPKLKSVSFVCCSYDNWKPPANSLIYCDPPYAGTTKYKDNFDHEKFWQWCRDRSNEGHTVFVSEYEAPEDFKCIWEKEQVSSLTKDTGSKRAVERLFTL